MITSDAIKDLRAETGVSVMQCKRALEEGGGDKEKALILLRKKGSEIAAKKSARTLGAGVVASYVHANGNIGALVLLSCETDFVARNEEFKRLAYDIAMHVAAQNPDFLRAEDISEAVREKVRETFAAEVESSGKEGEIKEKMLQGKMDAYFNEKTLLTQGFIKDQDTSIAALVSHAIQKFGEKIEITKFIRLSA